MNKFSYSPLDYAGLPTLNQAVTSFDESISQRILDTDICELFEKYDVAPVFGMGLLHRHFDMADDEVLVEHGSTSTPWNIPPNPLNFMGGHIMPHSWHFADNSDTPRPYEFSFEPHGEAKRPAAVNLDTHAEFIDELRSTLVQHGLTSILGLVALAPEYLPSDGKEIFHYEKTFGRANVVFEVGLDAMKEKDKRTSVWVFGKGMEAGREGMFCMSGCICSRDD